MTASFSPGSNPDENQSEDETSITQTMETDDEEDQEKEKAEPPSIKYRQLARQLSGLDPRVVDLVEERSRAFTNNIKSYLATDKTTRDRTLPEQPREKKRKRVEEVAKKLDEVRKDRTVLSGHLGSSKPTPLTGKKKIPVKDKVTMTSVTAKATKHIMGEDGEYARPYGQQKGAFNLKSEGVRAIYPEVKIGEQTRQYLGNLSNLLFSKVSTMEVEAMLVNDRILVSTNETSTVTQLAGLSLGDLLEDAARAVVADNSDHALLRRYKIGVVGQALTVVDSAQPLTTAQLSGVKELSELETGFRTDHAAREELESFLRVLKKQVQTAISVAGPFSIDVAAKRLTDPAYKHRVIAVSALDGGKSHAEQHLTLALIKSKFDGRAVVAGTKNPCSMCWLTLTLAHQNGWDIEFNNKAGGYWDTTVVRGLTEVAEALGIRDITDLWNMFVETNKLQPGGTQFVQCLTSLREGTKLTIKVPKKGGGLAEKGFTQDTSGLHKDFMDTTTDNPFGAPYADPPKSPPGFYGTPPTSPRRLAFEEEQSEYEKQQAEAEALAKTDPEKTEV